MIDDQKEYIIERHHVIGEEDENGSCGRKASYKP
jgi:hypothetical protein